MYQISGSELTKLETNLQTLSEHNQQKEQRLMELQKQLSEASEALETVSEQLKTSRTLNEQTANSLEKANQSLNQLEKEARSKIRAKARQRNLWIIISGALAAYCIAK